MISVMGRMEECGMENLREITVLMGILVLVWGEFLLGTFLRLSFLLFLEERLMRIDLSLILFDSSFPTKIPSICHCWFNKSVPRNPVIAPSNIIKPIFPIQFKHRLHNALRPSKKTLFLHIRVFLMIKYSCVTLC